MTDIKLQTHKVAAVPYRFQPKESGGEELQFLVHLPKPKNAGEEDQIKWGVARGTVGYEDKKSNGNRDIESIKELETLDVKSIEDHWVAAQREALEELGVSDNILRSSMKDHGIVNYCSESKPLYPIHLYSFQLGGNISSDVLKQQALDSQDVAWKSLDEIKQMAHGNPFAPPNQQFKSGYVEILEQVAKEISANRKQGDCMQL